MGIVFACFSVCMWTTTHNTSVSDQQWQWPLIPVSCILLSLFCLCQAAACPIQNHLNTTYKHIMGRTVAVRTFQLCFCSFYATVKQNQTKNDWIAFLPGFILGLVEDIIFVSFNVIWCTVSFKMCGMQCDAVTSWRLVVAVRLPGNQDRAHGVWKRESKKKTCETAMWCAHTSASVQNK